MLISGLSAVIFADPLLPLAVPVHDNVPVLSGHDVSVTSILQSVAPQALGSLSTPEITGLAFTVIVPVAVSVVQSPPVNGIV